MTDVTEAEALALLRHAGIEAPDPALVTCMAVAGQRMRDGLARQPRDLAPGIEPAAAFAVPRP